MSVNLIAVGVLFAMAVGVGWALVRFGRRDQQSTDIKGAIDEIKVAQEVQRENDAMSDADIAERLRKWTRK